MSRSVQTGVVVIGGGILGTLIADLAAERGYSVTLYRQSDRFSPSADTLRNHGWFQSGLLYAKTAPLAAAKMRHWGRAMLQRYGLPIPQDPGVFRTATEGEAQTLVRDAATLRLSVERMPDREARTAVGDVFHTPGAPTFWVPDAPYDQSLLLRVARESARSQGARLIDLPPTEHAVFVPDAAAAHGYLVKVGHELVDADVVILSAGKGTLALLEQLMIPHALGVFRSPMLVLDDAGLLERVPLLVDRSTGLGVLRHGKSLVFGDRTRSRLDPADAALMERRIPETEIAALRSLLPPTLRLMGKCRVTAGYKTEALNGFQVPSIEPYVVSPSGYPWLVVATPGKATLGLYTAQWALDMARLSGSEFSALKPKGAVAAGVEWTGVPRMHWEYGALNERAH